MVSQQLSLALGPVESFTEESDDYLGYCGVGLLPGVAATGVSGGPSTPAAGSYKWVALVTVTGPGCPAEPPPTAAPGPKLATVVPGAKCV